MGDAGSSKRPRLDGGPQELSRTYERALAEASMQLRGQSSLRLPWEKGIYAEIFSGSELPTEDAFIACPRCTACRRCHKARRKP